MRHRCGACDLYKSLPLSIFIISTELIMIFIIIFSFLQFVVDYAEKHETAAGVVGTELGVARDMVKLLPLKLEKMLGSPDGGS